MCVSQSCPTLCNPMDCSPPGSSVHGILQARILEWVAIPFSRVSFRPRDQTHVPCITSSFFTIWVIREAQFTPKKWANLQVRALLPRGLVVSMSQIIPGDNSYPIGLKSESDKVCQVLTMSGLEPIQMISNSKCLIFSSSLSCLIPLFTQESNLGKRNFLSSYCWRHWGP